MEETTITFKDAFLLGVNMEFVGSNMDRLFGYTIRNLLQPIIDNLQRNNFSRKTQEDISRLIEKFKEELSINKKVNSSFHLYFREKIEIWKERLTSEFENLKAIPVFTRGDLNIDKLYNGADTFFNSEIWEKMPRIAKIDLIEAAYCLLTRAWTAAVMVAMRAVEDTIRRYYNTKSNTDPGNKGLKTLINELEQLPDVPKPLLNYFDYIRDVRNSADHPDKIFDHREADRLFLQACGLIQTIYEEIG